MKTLHIMGFGFQIIIFFWDKSSKGNLTLESAVMADKIRWTDDIRESRGVAGSKRRKIVQLDFVSDKHTHTCLAKLAPSNDLWR